jgi:hypothetical protein
MNESRNNEPKTANSPPVAPTTAEQGGNLQAISTDGARTINELTPEEQMALYEKELKENDWGHQPC